MGEESSNNLVGGNEISGSTYHGINLFNAHENTVLENMVEKSTWAGIRLAEDSSANWVSGNKISGCSTGIFLKRAFDNPVLDNSISSSKQWGIAAVGNSMGNLIKDNSVLRSHKYDLYQDPGSVNTWEDNKYKTSQGL